jgi:hypothetical protein
VALTAGSAATLLLAAWVCAAGPVGILNRQGVSRHQTSAPGEEYGTSSTAGTKNLGVNRAEVHVADPLLVRVIDWTMRALLVLVAVAVIAAVARVLLNHWRGQHTAPTTEVLAEVLPEVLLARARESEELLAHGTPANAVVAAWVALESAVRLAGVQEDHARTSAELVTTVLRSYAVDSEPLDRLAALYREARFSRHEMGEDLRNQARAALQRVQADLTHRAASRQTTTGSAR